MKMSKSFFWPPHHGFQVRRAWLSYFLCQYPMLSNFQLLVIKIRAFCLIFLSHIVNVNVTGNVKICSLSVECTL